MKDSRFIELLNLYIDRQISAVETAELEAELQANPRRRTLYRQYCQMHRATQLVGESFRADAHQEPLSTRATTVRLASQNSRARGRWAYAGASLAAAACVAFALVRYNQPQATTSADVTTVATTAVSPKVGAPTPAPVVASVQPERPVVLAGLRSVDVPPQDYAAMLAALRKEEREAFASGQIQNGRAPVSLFEDGVFESQRFWPEAGSREFRSRSSAPAQQAEFTAFQFQR